MKKRLMMVFASLFLFIGMAMAQTKVSGTVLSYEDNEPVVGAAVRVVGTNIGTVTDVNGKFSITCPEGKNMLSISYIGMELIQVSARENMRILLKNDSQNLDEIVVTGYGVTRKAAFTGAASTLGKDQIANKRKLNTKPLFYNASPHSDKLL